MNKLILFLDTPVQKFEITPSKIKIFVHISVIAIETLYGAFKRQLQQFLLCMNFDGNIY